MWRCCRPAVRETEKCTLTVHIKEVVHHHELVVVSPTALHVLFQTPMPCNETYQAHSWTASTSVRSAPAPTAPYYYVYLLMSQNRGSGES